jgi:hypothetical protein
MSIKIASRFAVACFTLVAAVVLLPVAHAWSAPMASGSAVINSAQVNVPAPGSVTINGANFATPPVVKLAGSSLVVQPGFTSTKVVATLPGGLFPGDYLLTVSTKNNDDDEDDDKSKIASLRSQ